MYLDVDIEKTFHSANRHFELKVKFQSDSQRIVIFGPSGSGKSLTLKAIAGLIKIDQGHIRLDSRVLTDKTKKIFLSPQQRNLAYLFQDYALFPHLTVRQNISFGLTKGWFNPGLKKTYDAVDYWLNAFELAALADQLPDQLSGGQRQRTALARALVAQPEALLLDEPFTALDADLREVMRKELDQLQQRLQVPMIMITHDPEDVAIFGQHVLTINNGRIVSDDIR